MNDHYTGAGHDGNAAWGEGAIRGGRRHQWQEVDHNRNAELMGWQPSPEARTRGLTAQLLRELGDYNRIVIRSWDLVGDARSSGTIARFHNTQTHARSEDFRITLRMGGFDRLNPNTDRLREEMDMVAIQGESGQWQRWAGANPEHDVQLLVLAKQRHPVTAWLSLADQIFIPIINRAQENIRNQARVDFEQANDIKHNCTIIQALDFQRMWEQALLENRHE